MRQKLILARTNADLSRAEVAGRIGITERMYHHIENGTREGKGRIWDALEALFGIPQRQLREQTTKAALAKAADRETQQTPPIISNEGGNEHEMRTV